jgi:translation initiation factor 1
VSKKSPSFKIETSGEGAGLLNPFAALNLEGLPPGSESITSEPDKQRITSKKGRVVLRRETAQRGGKVVVVAGDFESRVPQEEIEDLARQLRKACGCGGTVRDREIEIQGDQPDKICALLEASGFRVAGVKKGSVSR